MMIEDHIRTARDLMDLADRKFMLGENMQGSEKVWESVTQAVIAVAKDRGWSHDSYAALRDVTVRLSKECGDSTIEGRFALAENFRHNAQIGFMEDFQLDDDRVEARLFVRRIAELLSGKIVFI